MHQTKRLSVLGIVVTILGAILVLLNSRVPSVVHAQSNTYQTTVYASYRFHTLKNPTGLAYVPYDWSGVGHPYLIVVDTGNNLIRTFDMPAGTLSTRAGSGTAGYLNGGYLYAEFDKPTGIDVVNTSWRDSNNKYHYYTIYYVGDTN